MAIGEKYVYFLQGKETLLIKIGTSGTPLKRIKGMQLSEPTELLGLVRGGKQLESALHEQFAEYRVVGEWFRSEVALLNFIHEHNIFDTHIQHLTAMLTDDSESRISDSTFIEYTAILYDLIERLFQAPLIIEAIPKMEPRSVFCESVIKLWIICVKQKGIVDANYINTEDGGSSVQTNSRNTTGACFGLSKKSAEKRFEGCPVRGLIGYFSYSIK